MIKYVSSIKKTLEGFSQDLGRFVVTHEMRPVTLANVSHPSEQTCKWDLVDIITVYDKEDKETFSFEYNLLEIPHKQFDGYKLDGKVKSITHLYERSKGWHFGHSKSLLKKEQERSGDVDIVIETKALTFNSNFSKSSYSLSYIIFIEPNTHALMINKERAPISNAVSLAVFLKALTGLSFTELKVKLNCNNSYLNKTFSYHKQLENEPTRMDCVDAVLKLANAKGVDQFKDSLTPEGIITKFRRMFVGPSVVIGEDSMRIINQVSFKKLVGYVLAEDLVVPHTGVTFEAGKLLTANLLEAIDHSSIDTICCKQANSPESFRFTKYGSFVFRIPADYNKPENPDAQLKISDLVEVSAGNETVVKLKGVDLERLPLPTNNSDELIFDMINIYINYLSGFEISTNDNSLNNQAVISVETDILNTISAYIGRINEKLADLQESPGYESLLLSIPLALDSLDNNVRDRKSLITKYAHIDGKISPLLTSENSLALLSQSSLIIKDVANPSEDMYYLQPTQIGRFDPFEVPENENIGTTHSKTIPSVIDSDAQIKVPFVKITNCTEDVGFDGSPKIHYLSVEDEKDKYIAEWNADFSEDVDPDEVITVRFNDNLMRVPKSKVSYKEASCYQHMSMARAMSPFPESMSGKRALMASAQGKQSIPIIGAERPLVNSGAESIICKLDSTIPVYLTAQDLLIEHLNVDELPADYSDFTLQLQTFASLHNDRRYVFAITVKGVSKGVLEKTLPYSKVSVQKTSYGYNIIENDNMTYTALDLVFHSVSFDSHVYKKEDRLDFVNEGALTEEMDKFENGLALGTNLKVGYMTYGSSTIDDAIVINDRLVTEDTLSSVIIHKEECELLKSKKNVSEEDFKEEFFGFKYDRVPEGFSNNGLPKKGTYLNNGDVVIYKCKRVMEKTDSGTLAPMTYETNIRLPSTISGEVISVVQTENKGVPSVAVFVASLVKMEVGDKMAGRYGNKGVIGKIVPNHLMPFDPSTGEPLDIILNPLGIPSRLNPSQVLEVTLGACCKQENTISVVTPFFGDMLDNVKALAEEKGVTPIKLMNPMTCAKTNYEVHVGNIYMYKLHHRSSTKFRSLNYTKQLDSTFNQPTGTGILKEKGQAVGEMETWSYLSYGAKNLLQELQTLLSTDTESFEKSKQILLEVGTLDQSSFNSKAFSNFSGEDVIPDNYNFTNDNDEHLMTMFRALGVQVVQDENNPASMVFKPMTDKLIRGLNSVGISTDNIVAAKKNLRDDQVIFSNARTGNHRWGYLELGCGIINPFWVIKGQVLKTLIIPQFSQGLDKDGELVDFFDIKYLARKRFNDLLSLTEDLCYLYKIPDGKELISTAEKVGVVNRIGWLLAKTQNIDVTLADKDGNVDNVNLVGKKGMDCLLDLFRTYDLEFSLSYYKLQQDVTSKAICNFINTLSKDANGNYSLNDYIITTFPVLPLRYRPAQVIEGKAADFDYFYKLIINKCKSSSPYEIYLAIAQLMGLHAKDENNKLGHNGIITYFTTKDKKGKVRSKMAKKRVQRSGRATLVPMKDININPLYLGVPYLMAIDIFGIELTLLLERIFVDLFSAQKNSNQGRKEALAKQILNMVIIGDEDGLWKQMQSMPNYSSATKDECLHYLDNCAIGLSEEDIRERTANGRPLWVSFSQCIKSNIECFLRDKVVVFGRQPSLHKHSIRAFKLHLVEGKSIQVHPLVCKGFNADFDGDGGYLIAPLTTESQKEAFDLMSVRSSIINSGNGDNILEPVQDILLGVYYLTGFKDNVLRPVVSEITPIAYTSVDSVCTDLNVGLINPSDWVTVQDSSSGQDNLYIATAGRILFNSIVPGGFTNKPYEDKYGIGVDGFSALRYDAVISGRVSDKKLYMSLPKIFTSIYEEVENRDAVIAYYQAISALGFTWSERSGISFNLRDLENSKLVSEYVENAKPIADMIDRDFAKGLMSDSVRRQAFANLYGGVRSPQFKTEFINQLDRTNNIFMMFDSKAKGSEDQIMQTCGLVGSLQKTKTDALESPITNNYASGLSSFEYFQTAYSTILGMMSTIKETRKPGELTRTLVYEFDGFSIESLKNEDNTPFVVPYRLNSEVLKLAKKQTDGTLSDPELIDSSSLEGVEITDDFIQPFLKRFGDRNFITTDLLNDIKIAGVPWFDTEIGRVHFDMVFPKYLSRLLLYRATEEPNLDLIERELPDGTVRRYFNENSIKELQYKKPRTIAVSLLCNCFEEKGISADAYGLYYDKVIPPNIGDFPGFEAAQAIGEPSAQLTISLVNKGGKSGESIEDGISVIKSAMQHAKFKSEKISLYAPINGYISMTFDPDTCLLLIEVTDITGVTKYSTEVGGLLPLVEEGQYVRVGTQLTTGNFHPLQSYSFRDLYYFSEELGNFSISTKEQVVLNPTRELISRIRYEIADFYSRVYENNSINILGRHLEFAAYTQTSVGVCVEKPLELSDVDLLSGKSYKLGKLVSVEAYGYVYQLDLLNATDIIKHNSGVLTACCYQDIGAVLGSIDTAAHSFEANGYLGQILTGSDIAKDDTIPKLFKQPFGSVDVVVPVSELGGSATVTNISSQSDILDDIFDAPEPDPVVIPDAPEPDPGVSTREMDLFTTKKDSSAVSEVDIPLDEEVDIPLDGEEDIPLDGEEDIPLDEEEDIPLDGEEDIPLDGESDSNTNVNGEVNSDSDVTTVSSMKLF